MRTNGPTRGPRPAPWPLVRTALLVPLLLGALSATGPARPERTAAGAPPPLPGRQLVERRRERGAARPERGGDPRLHRREQGAPPRLRRRRLGLGPDIYGMPYLVVPGSQPLEPVAFDYADESDDGAPGRPAGYPIPAEAKTQPKWIEGGFPGNSGADGDKHLLIVDRDNRLLFETWNTRCEPQGSPSCTWRAGSGAVFPLDSNLRRPDGWTSADAAGLAILPGLVRYDEAFGSGPIRHAFRFTVRATNGYVFPASHRAGQHERRAADGDAPAAEGVARPLGLPRAGPADLPGDEDLRPDRRRQRLGHVRPGDLRHPLGQRRPEPRVREPEGLRLRGRAARLAADRPADRPVRERAGAVLQRVAPSVERAHRRRGGRLLHDRPDGREHRRHRGEALREVPRPRRGRAERRRPLVPPRRRALRDVRRRPRLALRVRRGVGRRPAPLREPVARRHEPDLDAGRRRDVRAVGAARLRDGADPQRHERERFRRCARTPRSGRT